MSGSYTTTPRLGLLKPAEGADDDLWGGHLNQNADILDSAPPPAHTHTATEVSDFSEAVDDRVAALLVPGSNVTLSYDDAAGRLTIASSGGAPSDTNPVMDGTAAAGTSALYARGDHVHPTDTTRAPLNSPAFTGTPALPAGTVAVTAAPGDADTGVATTAFVTAAVTAAGGAVPSNANPAMDSTAAPGVLTTYSRGDHVHPTDTSRYAATNPNGYQTAAQVTAAVPVASSTAPVMDGTATIGVGTTWARADHIHPTDTSRYAASNPSGYQTAAQVTTALGGYAPLSGASFYGAVQVTSTTFTLNGTDLESRAILGTTYGSARWQLLLAEAGGEPGGNAGSNFALNRFSDTAVYLGTPFYIVRSTGIATFASPIVNGSDRRLKSAIEPVKNALAIIAGMQGIFFQHQGLASRQVGLVAQDVAEVLPEVVFETPANEEQAKLYGMKTGEPLLGIAYGQIVAVLIEAMKELAGRVTALEGAP